MKKIFISYTHDSIEHKAKVKDFADYLNSNDIECDLDQYEIFPEVGWTKWMIDKIQEASFVLIICTEQYKRKAESNTNEPSGGTWEGSIIRKSLFDLGNINRKFIPVCFGKNERVNIPNYLSDYTCFDLQNTFEIEQLLDLIKKDIFSRKPTPESLSSTYNFSRENDLHHVDSKTNENSIVLISVNGNSCIIEFSKIINKTNLTVNINSISPNDSIFLQNLNENKQNIFITFGFNSFIVNLIEFNHEIENGIEHYELIFSKKNYPNLATMSDMALAGYTTEQIAEIRVKRILVNKHFISNSETNFQKILEDSIFSGIGTPIRVSKSPIPETWRIAKSFEEFKILAKLYSVTMLIHSAAVTSISKLEFTEENKVLFIDFEGIRDKQYSKMEPQIIKFKEPILLD
ncbi:SEFIR domain-containing protein [Leptospira sp. WS4.C2]